MKNNKNKFAFNDAHLQNIERKFEEKTGVRLEQRPNRIQLNFRKPVIIIALMICFTMLVSATVVIINQMQYIPFKGFVENGEYEIYYTPEILKLGNTATVETVTRIKDGKTSDLSIIITDTLDPNIKIITEKHGEFDLTPVIDYRYSSFGTLGQFQFHNEGGYSSYGYFIKDFPEINEFTLVSGNESIEIKLVPSSPNDVLTAEDSGVSIRFYRMSKGSKVLAYEMRENYFDIKKILGANYQGVKTVELGHWVTAYKLYDEKGNKINLNGLDYSGAGSGLGVTMFLRIGRDEKISRISINRVEVTVSMFNYGPPNYANRVSIPVPADGEEIIFDDGLLLYDKNGLISTLTSVTRKGNELTIHTDTGYNENDGENYENIEGIYMWFDGEHGSNMFGPGFEYIYINGDEDSINIWATSLKYLITGNWEIYFE